MESPSAEFRIQRLRSQTCQGLRQLFIGNMCRAVHRTLAGRVKKKNVVNGPRWVYWLVINTSVGMPGNLSRGIISISGAYLWRVSLHCSLMEECPAHCGQCGPCADISSLCKEGSGVSQRELANQQHPSVVSASVSASRIQPQFLP